MDPIELCLVCKEPLGDNWNGHDCKKCGYALPAKQRQMYPALISEKELAQLLGGPPDASDELRCSNCGDSVGNDRYCVRCGTWDIKVGSAE